MYVSGESACSRSWGVCGGGGVYGGEGESVFVCWEVSGWKMVRVRVASGQLDLLNLKRKKTKG